MGDPREPGNAKSGVAKAWAMSRPETVPCTCGAVKRGLFEPCSDDCKKKKAWKKFEEIFRQEIGRDL